MKEIQVDIQKQMADINDRLSAVEEKLEASKNCAEIEIARAVAEVVDKKKLPAFIAHWMNLKIDQDAIT